MGISLKNVSFGYTDELLFQSFDISFAAGSTTLIMGPSGSGKTTLLNLMMGLAMPHCGEIMGVPEKFSAVFQEDRLCEDFSAVRNLTIAGISAERAKNALAKLELSGFLDSPVREFSGGMKRRVAIARAVLANGGTVFMDEPFKGLDERMKAIAAAFIKENLCGRTLIAVSHDSKDAELLDGVIVDINNAQKRERC